MFRIRVEEFVESDIESVFEKLTDHENYKQFAGIERSVLLEEGKTEKNGVGALREIESNPFVLRERILEFERPTRMTYLIESTKPIGMRHHKGEITLTAEGSGTRVVWISEGHIRIPLLGNLVFDRMVEKRISRAFSKIILW